MLRVTEALPFAGPDKAALVCCDYRLRSVAQLEFRENAADMCAHRRLAEEQLRRDLAVCQATGDELQDVELAFAEVGERCGLRIAGRRTADEFVDHPLNDLGRDVDVAARSCTHGRDELGGRRVLEQETARTRLHRV